MCTPFDPEFPLLEIILKDTVSPRGLLLEENVCKSEKLGNHPDARQQGSDCVHM